MSNKTSKTGAGGKVQRQRYSTEFKTQALKRADQEGVGYSGDEKPAFRAM